jgi:hypothetical protein
MQSGNKSIGIHNMNRWQKKKHAIQIHFASNKVPYFLNLDMYQSKEIEKYAMSYSHETKVR